MAAKINLATVSILVILASVVGVANAATYVVGDSSGWTIPPNASLYSTWASQHTFHVGDILVFNFPTGVHDVAVVPKASYDGCASNNPTSLVTVGPARINLTSPGQAYFLCTFTSHCSLGQKLTVAVTAGGGSTTPPTPSPSVAPAPKSTPPPTPSTPAPTSPPPATPTPPTPAPTTPPSAPTPAPTTPPPAPTAGPAAPTPAPASGPAAPTPAPASGPAAPTPAPASGSSSSPPAPAPSGSLSPPPPPSSAPTTPTATMLVMLVSFVIGNNYY